jgi:hypothetical protein
VGVWSLIGHKFPDNREGRGGHAFSCRSLSYGPPTRFVDGSSHYTSL